MPSLADTYVERMKVHPFGFALYHPASSRILRPGAVGFFDSFGAWVPIAHLEDSESLSRHGLRFPKTSLTIAKTERISGWTPKVSTGVSEISGGVTLGASGAATGLPADARLRLEYGTSSESGAVLITSSPVTRNGYYYQGPFQEWVKANARALLHGNLAADIKEHGLFVVTQTYAAEKVALTAWQDSKNKAYFGFGVAAMGLGEISPRVQWYTGRSEAGWNFHGAEPGELKVMFAGGLAYRKLWPMTNSLHRTASPSRGFAKTMQDNRVLVAGPDGEQIELECETWGIQYEADGDDEEEDFADEDEDEHGMAEDAKEDNKGEEKEEAEQVAAKGDEANKGKDEEEDVAK